MCFKKARKNENFMEKYKFVSKTHCLQNIEKMLIYDRFAKMPLKSTLKS